MKKNSLRILRTIKKDFPCWIFLLPWAVGFCMFLIYPLFMSLFYSFTDFNGSRATKFGLFNFERIFSTRPTGLFYDVLESFGITFGYALVSVPIGMVLSFALALLVYKKMPGIRVFRLLYYLPVLIPGIVSSLIMRNLYSSDGLVNSWLTALGLPTNTFFESADTVFWTVIITGFSGLGGGIIMWLAALNNIPPEVVEAARIDGAGYFRSLIRIMLPMCSPIIFYNLFNSVIASLQMFGTYAQLGTGPDNSMYFICIRIFITAFTGSRQMGLASALAWILFIITAVLSAIMFRFSKWVFYGEDNA